MYTVRHHSYTGLCGIPEAFETHAKARAEVASRLRRYRKRFPVVMLNRGASWEIQEHENAVGVPDACGTLVLRRITFECAECGSQCDTRSIAFECCNPTEIFCEDEE